MNELNSTIEQEEIESLESAKSKKQRFFNDLKYQYAALPMAIFADVRKKKITHRDVCLYTHLLVKQGKNRSAFWGIDNLALLTGTNKTSVKDSLRRLLACGHIKRQAGKSSTHTICLTNLLPGLGYEGIRVKGKKVEEGDEENDDTIQSLPARLPKVSKGRTFSEISPIPGFDGTSVSDEDTVANEAFLKELDANQAAEEAEKLARLWPGIQSLK